MKRIWGHMKGKNVGRVRGGGVMVAEIQIKPGA